MNLFTELFLKTYHNGVQTVKEIKTPIHFPEAESIFPAMFGNVIDGHRNAVWHLALHFIDTHDLCDVDAMLYQLSCEARQVVDDRR